VTRVTVLSTAEAVARRAADVMANQINDGRMRSADVHIALAGGSTPQRAYERLGEMQGTWSHVHLWLSDERCVPADHPDSNQLMVEQSLVSKLRAEDRPKVHGIRGDLVPEDAAWLYGMDIVRAIGEDPTFDLVLLGLGPDGHTASLFPGRHEAGAMVAPVIPVRHSPKPPPERISFSLPLMARARYTLLVATGEGKRDALSRVRSGDPELPVARLGEGLDEILCDEAAAG
jgi:6-phosphogluconolactonase